MGSITIHSVVNAGLLIDNGQESILIDGLNDKNIFYYHIQEPEINELIQGKTGSTLKGLLFTHCHVDHFNPLLVSRFCAAGFSGTVLLPEDTFDGKEEMEENIQQSGNRIQYIRGGWKEKIQYEIGNMDITWFKTLHTGKQYHQVPHYSFLIKTNGVSVYVSGDADYNDWYQVEMLQEESLQAAFFNPLHLNVTKGREILKAVPADEIYIYHLPIKKGPMYPFMERAMRQKEAMDQKGFRCRLLLEPTKLVVTDLIR